MIALLHVCRYTLPTALRKDTLHMWIFLFILAMFPLAFYWSDSVVQVFPSLAPYFPEKSSQAAPASSAASSAHLGPDGQPEVAGRWYTASTDKGYVAWALSHDGTYRLAVGCHAQGAASLQVTHISGTGLGDGLYLNYEFGVLQLGAGAYAGPDLVGSVAQFSELFLQSGKREVFAQFNMNSMESGQVARALQAECATSADPQ